MRQPFLTQHNLSINKLAFVLVALLCFHPFISSPIALIAGFLWAYGFGNPFEKINGKIVSLLLKISIIGLGFGIDFQVAIQTGKEGLFLTAFTTILILLVGFLLGRYLSIPTQTSHLIASGTAICGGSAIAAVAPIIKATEKDISVALGVVFLLNSVALLCFPFLGHYFELSQAQFGLWTAIAIHDTSSVVGAAAVFGTEALEVATTAKLARTLWIIPVSMLSVYLFKGQQKSIRFPWFILLFILAILWNSYFPLNHQLSQWITLSAKSLLVLTLFLVGAGLSIEKIKAAGWKPMALGLFLWIMIAVISLVSLFIFYG